MIAPLYASNKLLLYTATPTPIIKAIIVVLLLISSFFMSSYDETALVNIKGTIFIPPLVRIVIWQFCIYMSLIIFYTIIRCSCKKSIYVPK